MASFVLYNCPQSKINIRSVLGDLSEIEVSLVYRGRPYLENKHILETHLMWENWMEKMKDL